MNHDNNKFKFYYNEYIFYNYTLKNCHELFRSGRYLRKSKKHINVI